MIETHRLAEMANELIALGVPGPLTFPAIGVVCSRHPNDEVAFAKLRKLIVDGAGLDDRLAEDIAQAAAQTNRMSVGEARERVADVRAFQPFWRRT